MLLLTFRAAECLYAVDVSRVVEVVPRIDLRRLPHAPGFLAGVFDYRGLVVPVVDLGVLLGAETCANRLSTRIILVDSRPADPGPRLESAERHEHDHEPEGSPRVADSAGGPREERRWLLGIVAEQVSDVAAVNPERMISAAMQLPQSPYLGSIVAIDREMVQMIEPVRILDESLRTAFFGAVGGAPTADPRAGEKTGTT